MKALKVIVYIIIILLAIVFLYAGMTSLSMGVKFGIYGVVGAIGLVLLIPLLELMCRHLPRLHNVLLWSGTIILAIGIVLCTVASVQMLSAANNKSHEAKVVVVLGCGLDHQTGTIPSLMLASRLNAAVEYLDENPEAVCVVTGGQGKNENVTEASAERKYLIGKGVAQGRILLEDKSTNTEENLSFAKEILLQNGITDTEIAVATNEFHMLRSLDIAKSAGFTPSACSAPTNGRLLGMMWIREMVAVVLRVWL